MTSNPFIDRYGGRCVCLSHSCLIDRFRLFSRFVLTSCIHHHHRRPSREPSTLFHYFFHSVNHKTPQTTQKHHPKHPLPRHQPSLHPSNSPPHPTPVPPFPPTHQPTSPPTAQPTQQPMSSVSSPQIIVLFVILGAAGAVTVAYAIARFFIREEGAPLNPHDVPVEQAEYMRQVRERGRAWAWEEAYGGGGGGGGGKGGKGVGGLGRGGRGREG